MRKKRIKNTFSLIEVLITALILNVLLISLLMAFSIGPFSYEANSVKQEVQSGARLAMDWIIKDLRQVSSWNVASSENNPTTSHIKFNLWTWNGVTETWDLSADFIEYSYDENEKTITRMLNQGGNLSFLHFNNIIEEPFYTTYAGSGAPSNALDAKALRNDRKLIVVIRGQKEVRGSLPVSCNLKSEIKMKNG